MKKVVIVGGCGHVGIPLGLAMASKGFHVSLLDINEAAIASVNAFELPFLEAGASELLREHVGKNLFATADEDVIISAEVVIFITGTPIDEHLNPRVNDVLKVMRRYAPKMNRNQLVVLRSTLYPGTMDLVKSIFAENGDIPKLAFCPERILQGKGVEEINNLPQLVSAISPEVEQEALELFGAIARKTILLTTAEAELAKLMTNCWRYLEFAIANQFYMMASEAGIDFYKVYNAMREDYPRASHFAKPGFAAGPCLFKDTMQLAAFHKNHFFLGHAAMLVNEGLPTFVADQLASKLGGSLKGRKIAILGMTFKADNDDIRESLSFKLKKVLEVKMANVITSDPYKGGDVSLEEALAAADGIILGVPHKEYLSVCPKQPFVDCWGIWQQTEGDQQ